VCLVGLGKCGRQAWRGRDESSVVTLVVASVVVRPEVVQKDFLVVPVVQEEDHRSVVLRHRRHSDRVILVVFPVLCQALVPDLPLTLPASASGRGRLVVMVVVGGGPIPVAAWVLVVLLVPVGRPSSLVMVAGWWLLAQVCQVHVLHRRQ